MIRLAAVQRLCLLNCVSSLARLEAHRFDDVLVGDRAPVDYLTPLRAADTDIVYVE